MFTKPNLNVDLNSHNFVEITNQMRRDILNMTTIAGSGHPTSSLSGVELMIGLFFGNNFFKCDYSDFENSNNDRIIFSKGHASPLFYSLYKALGLISEDKLMTFRRFESNLEGHPTSRFKFTEATTGSLGQGLGIGLGIALANRLDESDATTWVLLGDSEMAEGSVYEALELASHYKLNNLIGIIDLNRLGQRGETLTGWNLNIIENKINAFGWNTVVIEGGNDIKQVIQGLKKTKELQVSTLNPTMIIAKTKKGAGISFLEDQEGWHGKVLNKNQLDKALEELSAN